MSSLVSGIAAGIAAGIAGYLQRNSSGPDPNTILEVNTERYASIAVHCREDGLVLYGPSRDGVFEILLHKPYTTSLTQAFSLFRTPEVQEAEIKFLLLRDKLPVLLDMVPELRSQNMLQKVCDLVREHPTWTIAHLVVQLDLVDCLKSNLVTSHLSKAAEQEGVTPLHLAVKNQSLKMIQALMAEEVPLEGTDSEGNTVFHYAAGTNKNIIQVLAAKHSEALNVRNNSGFTPLHTACKQDKPECVKALLCAGADANIPTGSENSYYPIHLAMKVSSAACAKEIVAMYPNQLHAKDMKFGGTPLHWAKGKQVMEALLELGCNLEVPNFEGDTALHVMVERDRFPCMVVLLCHGAKLDAPNKEGNTPLHLAVLKGNASIIQALIVFGANIHSVNGKGESVRHLAASSRSVNNRNRTLHLLHSVGASRCLRENVSCGDGCKPSGSFDGTPPENPPGTRTRHYFDEMLAMAASSRRRTSGFSGERGDQSDGGRRGGRLLCLDGGGIRGLVLIQILIELEEMVQRPVPEMFDWIAGTSTGGMLTLALATGNSARKCQSLYFCLKDKIFIGNRPYASEPFEQFLKNEFGEETTMASIKSTKVLVTGVLADRYPADLHFFRNYPSPESILGLEPDTRYQAPPSPERQLVWRAARSSGAAPTYFRASGRFIDGGLIANNPTLDALTEIHEYNVALRATGQEVKTEKLSLVVSLGTGRCPVTQVEAIDIFRPENLWDTARLAFGISALGRLLVDQAASSDGRVVDRARAWCSTMGVPYFRFSPLLSEDVQLDETKDEVLMNMLWETKAYVYSKRKDFQQLLPLLSVSSDFN